MSALSTPGQDELQQPLQPPPPQQDNQPQIQVQQQLPQDAQNGDTPPVSEGSRKRESLPVHGVARWLNPAAGCAPS